MRKRFWALLLVSAAVICANASHASAKLSITARAEAGIDPATREFLRTLPSEWQPQLAGIVDATITRVDASVKEYLGELDSLISFKLLELQCRAIATTDAIVGKIFDRFPLMKQSGGPMEKLQTQVDIEKARRRADSPPTFIKHLYDDLMLAASILPCQPGALGPVLVDAEKIRIDLARRWLVWNRAQSLGCETATACLEMYKRHVNEVAGRSDPRDLERSNAIKLIAAVSEPERPSGVQTLFGRQIDFNQLEDTISSLYAIENSIGAAQGLREGSAIRKLQEAEGAAVAAKSQINNIHSGLTKIVYRRDQSACQILFSHFRPQIEPSFVAPRDLLDKARVLTNEAITLSTIVQDEVTSQAKSIAALMDRTNSPQAFCAG